MEPPRDTPLRQARLRRGLSQHALQTRANVSQSLVSDLEQGHTPTSVRAVIRIARALGLTVEELFGADAATPSSTRGRRRLIPLDELGDAPVVGTGT